MTPTRVLLFGMAVALLPAQAPRAIKGKMTVAGKTSTLSQAYPLTRPGLPGHDEIVVVLSDVEIPAAARSDHSGLVELAKTGKIHFVRLTSISGQTDVFGIPAGRQRRQGYANRHDQ